MTAAIGLLWIATRSVPFDFLGGARLHYLKESEYETGNVSYYTYRSRVLPEELTEQAKLELSEQDGWTWTQYGESWLAEHLKHGRLRIGPVKSQTQPSKSFVDVDRRTGLVDRIRWWAFYINYDSDR